MLQLRVRVGQAGDVQQSHYGVEVVVGECSHCTAAVRRTDAGETQALGSLYAEAHMCRRSVAHYVRYRRRSVLAIGRSCGGGRKLVDATGWLKAPQGACS